MSKVVPASLISNADNNSSQQNLVTWVPKLSQSSRGFSSALSLRKLFQREDIYDLKAVAEELARGRSNERTDHSIASQNNRYHTLKPWYLRIFQFPKVRRLSPLKFYRHAQHGDLLLSRCTTPTMMIPLSTTIHHQLLSTLSGKYIPKNYSTEYWNEVSVIVVLPDEARVLVKYVLSISAVGITLSKLSTAITKAQHDHAPLGLRAIHVANERVAQGYTLCLRKLAQAARAGRLTWYNLNDVSSFADMPIIGTIITRYLSRLQFIIYQHSHESIVEASRCFNLMNTAREERLALSVIIKKLGQMINANMGGATMKSHFEKLYVYLNDLQQQQQPLCEEKDEDQNDEPNQPPEEKQEDVPMMSLSEFVAAFATVSCTEIPTECDVHAVASAEFVFSVVLATGVCTEDAAASDHYFLPQVFSSHGREIGAVSTRIKPWIGLQKFMVAEEIYMDDDVILKIK